MTTPDRRHNRAFTMLEAVMTFVVASILIAVVYVGVNGTSQQSINQALFAQLAAVRSAGRAVAAGSGGEYPTGVARMLPLSGVTAVTGASTTRAEVSVARINTTRIAYTVSDGKNACVGVWDDLERTGSNQTVWFVDNNLPASRCNAAWLAARDTTILGFDKHHTSDDPADCDFDDDNFCAAD